MSLHLYILRHAQTLEKLLGQTDLERPLSIKGREDAMKLGQFMSTQKIIPDLILCSPAVRTQVTAKLISDSLYIAPEKTEVISTLYHSNSEGILNIVRSSKNEVYQLMLIGHNPAISNFANNMVDKDIGSFAPCTLAVIHFATQKWREVCFTSGQLVFIR